MKLAESDNGGSVKDQFYQLTWDRKILEKQSKSHSTMKRGHVKAMWPKLKNILLSRMEPVSYTNENELRDNFKKGLTL